MNSHTYPDINALIIGKAKAFRASLPGIASIVPLKASPSCAIYDKSPCYEGYDRVEWPGEAKSVLVLALLHEASGP
jgi:hypothetical protein